MQYIKNCNKNLKILNWRIELENYDYTIMYKEGKTNVVADALSRKIECNKNETNRFFSITDTEDSQSEENNNPLLDENHNPSHEENNNPSSFLAHNNTNGSENMIIQSSSLQTIHSAEDSSDFYIHSSLRPVNYYKNQIIFKIDHSSSISVESPFGNIKRTIVIQPEFTIQDITGYLLKYHNGKQTGILAPEMLIQTIQEAFKRNLKVKGHFVMCFFLVEDVIETNRQNLLISTEHNRAHRGITEVEAKLKRSYFFPKMQQRIKQFTNSCEVCNTHKYERKPYNIKISPIRPITEKPLDRVHIDIFIINHESFLSVIDAFSKHLQMYSLKHKNLIDVQKAMTKYFSTFGSPRQIITDHETTFRSLQFKNFLTQLGTSLEYASSSESNGQIERTHSTIIELYNTNKHKFPRAGTKQLVKIAVTLYNETIHSATKFTPNEIIFNQNSELNPEQIRSNAQKIFEEVKNNLLRSHNRVIKSNSTKENPPKIDENQDVFVLPNIRTKTQPRAHKTTAHQITDKTFKNIRDIKRNKSKIKRFKKNT